jgi:hypothetical protein
MNLLQELNNLGVDTEDALKRFMNNTSLYERMLGKLPKNIGELEVMPYLETGNYSQALTNAHTIKGVTGNLSVTPLFTGYTNIVALLRQNEPEKAKSVLEEILPIQNQIISCINNCQ